MKNAKREVNKFKKKHKINKAPTSFRLKQLINEYGFEVCGYKENQDKLYEIEKYKLSKETPAFSYIKGNKKIVFYDDLLNDVDTARVLAHELGHIYYNHFHRSVSVFDTKVQKEREASLFAAYLLNEPDYKALLLNCLLPVCILSVGIFIGLSLSSPSVPALNPNQTELSEFVYITPTGHSYHTENCHFGKEYANSFTITRTEAQEHYLPCSLCNSDKY